MDVQLPDVVEELNRTKELLRLFERSVDETRELIDETRRMMDEMTAARRAYDQYRAGLLGRQSGIPPRSKAPWVSVLKRRVLKEIRQARILQEIRQARAEITAPPSPLQSVGDE